MNDLKLEEVYFYLLERTVRQFRKYSQALFTEHNIYISGDQWVILKRISEREGINQKEIADQTYKDPASVTRMLDLLEKQQLVKRVAVENDRRTYALFLTEQGKELVTRIKPLATKARQKGLEGFNTDDHERLKLLLNKIYENLS